MRRSVFLGLAAAVVAVASSYASAASYSYEANDGISGGLDASVTFNLTGTTLTVTLKNLTTSAVTQNGAGLTAVFWDSAKSIGGSFSGVSLASGSSILNGTNSEDGNGTGTGWFGYSDNANPPTSQTYAVSSAGLGINYTSPIRALNGLSDPPVSTPPQSPDGPNGSLVGTGGSSLTAVIATGWCIPFQASISWKAT